MGMKMKRRRQKLTTTLIARAGAEGPRAKEIAGLVDAMPKKTVVLMEAITGTALGDWGTDNDPQLVGYRRLTGTRNGKLTRDLSPLSQESATQVAHYLHTSNPMAKWCIDQRVRLIVGGEVGYSIEFDAEKMDVTPDKAKDLAVKAKAALDPFWEHEAHSIRFRGPEYLATFMVTGELCLVLGEPNETLGTPQLDYVDSQRVTGVIPLGKSSMVPGTVMIEAGMGNPPVPKQIVRMNPETDRLEGECFYWRNGLILNAMRGQSELLAPADFMDSLDNLMFSQVDRALLQNQVVWDLLLEGANDTQIKQRIAELRAELTKPGGIFGHNEKGTLTPAVPSLGAENAGDLQRVIANHIRGSMSLPESWYSEGGNANRATAGDQTDVAYKTLESWQTLAKRMFNTLLWYAYDNLVAKQEGAGYPKRSDGAVKLEADLAPVRERDMGRAAETAVKLQPALEAAVEAEMLSKRTAQKVLLQVVEKISGTAIDPDDEAAQIEAEVEDRERMAQQNANALARDKTEKALRNVADGDGEDEDAGTPQPAGAAVA